MKVVLAATLNLVRVQHMFTDEFLQDLYSRFPSVDFNLARSPDEQLQHIGDADAIFGMPTATAFRSAKKLRWIHIPGTGANEIESVPELVDSDVIMTNTRGSHANPMADHVFGVMLIFAHRMRELWQDQQARHWETGKYDLQIMELSGRTLGILALGDIGMAVARRGYGFGMEVYGVEKREMSTPPELRAVWGTDRLDELLSISDWFVVTAPLTPETEGLIGADQLALMKRTAHVIVLSRGGIVDEPALIEALQSGQIAGAGIDAPVDEPLPPDSPLWDMENVVLSPHSSALTPEMWEGRKEVFRENLRRFMAGEPLQYVVDKKAGF
jgi:phosphoglycerate dehydrogenase-like enzyme